MTEKIHVIACAAGSESEALRLAPAVTALRAQPDRFAVRLFTGGDPGAERTLRDLFTLPGNRRTRVRRVASLAELLGDPDERRPDERRPGNCPPDLLLLQSTAKHAPDLHAAAGARGIARALVDHDTGGADRPANDAELRFAATATVRETLLDRGADPASIAITGDTLVDAARWTMAKVAHGAYAPPIAPRDFRQRLVVAALTPAAAARSRDTLDALLVRHPDILLIQVTSGETGPAPLVVAHDRCHPVTVNGFGELVGLLARAQLAITDVETVEALAPCLRLPTLVLDDTSRCAGVPGDRRIRPVGTMPTALLAVATTLLGDREALASLRPGPILTGDGHAGVRIALAIARFLRDDSPPLLPEEQFDPFRYRISGSSALFRRARRVFPLDGVTALMVPRAPAFAEPGAARAQTVADLAELAKLTGLGHAA